MPLPQSFTFTRNRDFLAGTSSAGIEVVAVSDPDVLLALADDHTPFPAREIALGRISLSAEAGKDITFAGPKGNVSFKASASTSAGLGVYLDPKRVVEELAIDAADRLGLDFGDADGAILMLLTWRYDLAASAKGSVALGAAGAIEFGADGSRDAVFAVVRRFPAATPARTAIGDTANSWMMPSQVTSIDHLDPETWLVSEVNGRIGLELGAKFGYDFNWVREARLGGLAGDVGLRIQLSLAATLGFTAEGRYALVVGRETAARRLRLRLFKLDKKGWSFSFNGGATVQADFSAFLPESFDEFVATVFGVRGQQIVDVLDAVTKWTDPNTPLPDLIADFGVAKVKELLGEVTGIDVDDALSFANARAALDRFLELFTSLEHRVSTMLMRIAGENLAALGELRDLATLVSTIDAEGLRALLEERLSDVEFFSTPVGRWLEAAAGGAILRALDDAAVFRELRRAAELTARLLDNPLATVLEKVTAYVKKLEAALLNLRNMIGEGEFNALDVVLRRRIEELLGERLEFEKLDEVRKTINLLLEKRNEFYEKTRKALARKYTFSITAAYQRATTRTALLDLEFDFDAGNAGLGDFLGRAIGGEFDAVLVERHDGVTLHTAELTHGIERHSFVEVNLPFETSRVDHLNTTLARVRAVDEDEGRLLVYDVAAEDVVTERNKRDSRLAIALALSAGPGPLRVHAVDAASYFYSFKQAVPAMRKAQLQYQLKPYVDRYLPNAFPADGSTAPFDDWISDLDAAIDRIENNGTGQFGNTLVSLQLSLPPETVAAWRAAPRDEEDAVYGRLSRALQAELKELLPFYFFQDPERFVNVTRATALLVYAALPLSTAIRRPNGSLQLNAGEGPTWDLSDPAQRSFMVHHDATKQRLAALLTEVHERLKATPGFSHLAGDYNPTTQVDDMLNAVHVNPSIPILKPAAKNLDALVRAEIGVVKGAVEAGTRLARALGESTPSLAIAHLAGFGAALTNAFNNETATVYAGGALRPLGTLLFTRAAAVLGDAGEVEPDALLEIVVYRQTAQFPPAGFPSPEPPKPADLVLAQRLARPVPMAYVEWSCNSSYSIGTCCQGVPTVSSFATVDRGRPSAGEPRANPREAKP